MFYTIYKTTNLINNKIYIGYHCTDNPHDSYLGSGKLIKKAIEKHGRTNFRKDILFIYDNRKDMVNKEIELVNESFIARRDTYNLRVGGIGVGEGKANPMWGRYGELNHMWGKTWRKTDEQLLKSTGANNHEFKYTKEILDSIYDSSISIRKNAGNSGTLYYVLIKYVVDNNLDYMPNQPCIEKYKSRKRD